MKGKWISMAALLMLCTTIPASVAGNEEERKSAGTIVDVSPVIVVGIGETIEYSHHLTLLGGAVGFEVDERALNIYKAGAYTVYVTGIDAYGERGERVPVNVTVVDRFDEKKLFQMLDALVCELEIDGKSPEQICRDIYSLVRGRLVYTGGSEKGDIERAAYYALLSGGGDCYSYFSLAKLLLHRCGIENLDVVRASGYTEDTHYWSIVNIGKGDDERWYHFDTTELRRDEYYHSGCLLTEKQVMAYSRARRNFYSYERSLYPALCQEIITPTENLEAFY